MLLDPIFHTRNDVRSFLHQLAYLDIPAQNVGEVLRLDPKKIPWPYAFQMESLNGRVSQLALNEDLKGIWNVFNNAVQNKQDSLLPLVMDQFKKIFPPLPKTGPFFDTDLFIFPNDFPEDLPPNGIKENEFKDTLYLYTHFLQRLEINGNFQQIVEKDIRILLSRKIGRDFVRAFLDQINQTNKKIKVIPSNINGYRAGTIQYSIFDHPIMLAKVAGQRMTTYKPRYFALVHELIHAYHELKGENLHHYDHPRHPLGTNAEEERTIDGDCLCHGYDPFNEVAFQEAFKLPAIRWSHLKVLNPNQPLIAQFRSAAKYGVGGDLDRIAEATTILTDDVDRALLGIVDRGPGSVTSFSGLPEIIRLVNEGKIHKGRFLQSPIRAPSETEPPRLPSRTDTVVSVFGSTIDEMDDDGSLENHPLASH